MLINFFLKKDVYDFIPLQIHRVTTSTLVHFSETSPSVPFRASPVPVQFKNPLASARQKNNDKGALVEEGASKTNGGNDYAVVDKRRTDAPANNTFDNFADSL